MSFFDHPIVVTGLQARYLEYTRKKTVFVPGRPYQSLTFRQAGRITVEHGGEKLISSAGDLTFVPQGLSYDTQILEDGGMYIVQFTTEGSTSDLSPLLITPACPAAFRALFAELCGRFRVGKEQDAECLSIFYRILADAKREYGQAKNVFLSPRMRRARSRVDRDFSDPALTVSALAEEAGISETYFRREFHAAFGCAPLAYLKKVRLENAKLLLATGYCGVTETAMLCGFDNISYFSYEFHRYTGVTPSEYIRREDS